MNKMGLAYLGALLLALHLISLQVVQAQNTTESPQNTIASGNMTESIASSNMTESTVTSNMTESTVTSNMTVSTASKENGCGTTDSFTLLLPLAAAASLLLGWS